MDKQDEDLILEFQQGKSEALEMLYHRYKQPILNFSLRILSNRADAEDVTAEVFLVLFSKKDSYRSKAKFSTWIFTVAYNACITRIRKRKRVVSLWFTKDDDPEEKEWEIPDPNSLPSEDLAKKETALQVKRAIQNLPELQKEALVLREYHNLSYEEISQILDCSLENVKILIYRARERLKKTLPSFLREE